MGNLVQGTDGSFYGVTYGTTNGTVYKITTAGALTTLHTFSSGADGAQPASGLVEGSDGNFYGTTSGGGAQGDGTVYKVAAGGTTTTLYSFCSLTDCADGTDPLASLFLASDGNFYGAAYLGGNTAICSGYGCGTLFQVTPGGAFTLLYTFMDGDDGAWPYGSLIQGSDGNLYGAGEIGGVNNIGNIYRLSASPVLSAPIRLSPATANVNALSSVSYSWQSLNSFSATMQSCYAFATNAGGAVTALGKQTGLLSGGIYFGAFNYTPAASGSQTVAISCGGQETATSTLTVAALPTSTLLSMPGSIPAGETASITAAVTAGDAGPVNSGSVALTCGTLSFGKSDVVDGTATFSSNTARYAAGTYQCTGNYTDASATYMPSSGSALITITPQLSEISLASNPASPTVGDTVTLTATVDGQFAIPMGTVVFKIGGYLLGSAKLNPSGVASVQVNTAGDNPGPYRVTATFQGDFNTKPSSNTVGITLSPAPMAQPRAR